MRARKRSVGILVAAVAGVLVAVAVAVSAGGARAPVSGLALAAGEPMDLVYISDSSGWEVAGLYARHIRRDLSVKVRVHDEWEGGLAATTILERLRTPGHPWVRLIRNAEVIVVYGNPIGLGIEVVESGACAVGRCTRPVLGRRTWQRYVATLKAIYKQIFTIRKGKPVVMRTANWYVPIIYHGEVRLGTLPPGKSWEQCGLIDPCTRQFMSYNAAIARAAAAYRVPLADVYLAFNGLGHLEDPVEKGYIQWDNIHPSDAGRAVIAQTLADLGYAKVKAPR